MVAAYIAPVCEEMLRFVHATCWLTMPDKTLQSVLGLPGFDLRRTLCCYFLLLKQMHNFAICVYAESCNSL